MIYTLKTKLIFGKHKGKTLEKILNLDPLYIEWCINNINDFNLNKEAHDQIINILFNIHKRENFKKQRFEI